MTNWIALSRTLHSEAHWTPNKGFAFASRQQAVPVLISELSKAIPLYVLVFVLEGENYQFAALADVGEGRNIYINEKGDWFESYVPALLRGYPFVLASNAAGEKIFSIDQDYLQKGSESLPLFQSDGELAPEAAEKFNLLNTCEQSRLITQAACASLAAADLIEPWPLQVIINEAGEKRAISGISRINSEKLYDLDPEVFNSLRKNGALTIAYGQLFSMNQINRFGPMIQRRQQEHSKGVGTLLSDEGTLNFDAF